MQTPPLWLTLSDGSILTRQEQFVLRQVAAGEIADLKKQFGEAEEDRRLRARFLEELLTGELKGVKIHRRGVRIRAAVIEEPVDLENAEIAVAVGLVACIFKEAVNFRDAYLKEYFLLNNSLFFKEADFHRLKVENDIVCRNTIFRDSVNFGGATISGQFIAEKAKFLAQNQEASFNAMQVEQRALFDGSEFYGPVDFAGAKIGKKFSLEGTKFLAEEHKASFAGMQVGEYADFQGCDFHGLVSFVLIKVAGNLHLDPLVKTSHGMVARFHRDVNFRGAEIGGELLANKAQFLGHISNFEAVQVGRSFHASGAFFGGSVYFSEMKVKNNFYVDPFGRMKSFKTLFNGAANFSRVEVGGVFNADQAIFRSENVIFSGLRVGQGAFFNGAIFFAGLVMKEARLNDLEISGLHRLSRGGLPLTEIVLNRTMIAHRLTIEDLEVKRFEARNLEVKGPAELRRLFIREEADLRDAALHHLQVVGIDWPEPREARKKVFLDGLTYESISTRKEAEQPEDWPELLAWLGLGRFNTQNYQQLDAFFQRGGLRKWADKVHMAGKRRELGKLSRWNLARWLTRFFWGGLAGYGRKPGRTLWISLLLIILGALVLNPAEVLLPEFLNNLTGYQDNAVHRIALRLIVSLYSFVSAIPGWGSHLSLNSNEFHLFVYLWFQRICGWILIPIGLAALYTRLK